MVSRRGAELRRPHPSASEGNDIKSLLQPIHPSKRESVPQVARVRRRPWRPPPPSLVWVRRDKFESGIFTSEDCFPVGAADHLVEPKEFSFSVDFWSRREGRPTFAAVVRRMAGAGAAQGARGGRNAGGRGRNDGIRPLSSSKLLLPLL